MNPMAMRWGKLYKGTPAELALEDAVAEIGVPYRTQFPYYLYGLRFFPDFFLPTLGLIFEVDDPSHKKADKILADAERTAALEAEGWRVFRCTNDEALNDPRGTVRALLRQAGFSSMEEVRRAGRKRIAACLPKAKKAPQRQRREALSATRRAARGSRQPASVAPPTPTTPPEQPL